MSILQYKLGFCVWKSSLNIAAVRIADDDSRDNPILSVLMTESLGNYLLVAALGFVMLNT